MGKSHGRDNDEASHRTTGQETDVPHEKTGTDKGVTRTTVTREYAWAMGHRLQHHQGLCRHPHGHNYVAEVTVGTESITRHGAPDDGMVLDFGELDKVLRKLIDPWDHAFMVETSDPFLEALRHFSSMTGELPKVVEVAWPPTAERIAQELLARLGTVFPTTRYLSVTKVRVHEGPRSVAEVTAE